MERILVVDDEPDMNLALKVILENNNFKVDSFDDPILALKNFKGKSYDLLILDIKMPQMNGIKLYQEIRKVDDKVKVCFLTADQLHYEMFTDTFQNLDKNQFIQKPIENKDLIKKVFTIISSNCSSAVSNDLK
jgi:DNA-binding response OmpR family regulator